VSKYNLTKLKARAMREGMPYQTLINSILHKAVN
jgi:predicted DNA binding CopG/RHH family protein